MKRTPSILFVSIENNKLPNICFQISSFVLKTTDGILVVFRAQFCQKNKHKPKILKVKK